jgi:hypothetical protein
MCLILLNPLCFFLCALSEQPIEKLLPIPTPAGHASDHNNNFQVLQIKENGEKIRGNSGE